MWKRPRRVEPIEPHPLPDGFDEAFYLAAHPDVRAAVAAGAVASGAAHFQAHGWREDRETRAATGQDGLPLPSSYLMDLVTNGRDPVRFEAAGAADLAAVRQAVRNAGLRLPDGGLRVLDWGCGCGRLARHWASDASGVDLFGCDINPALVAWCRDHLPFGTFAVSPFEPPLAYADGSFDLIYGISVLTHLTFEQHHRWVKEIHRLLKPSGVAVLTAHGPTMFPQILSGARTAYDSGKVRTHLIDEDAFICLEHADGSNASGNVLTGAMFDHLFRGFDVRLHVPRYGLMGIQDTYVVAKRSARLRAIDDLCRMDLQGEAWRSAMDLDLDGARAFSVLADVTDLYFPATIELRFRWPTGETKSSGARPLPDKVAWTHLDKAYASIAIDDLPALRGPVRLEVDVTGSKPLDGGVLTLSKAFLF